ncbi:MAG TPA: hypothetical protein VME68_02080 [Acidobacteriaceae bacterium]|nr:hypothetical protein [Acidobacteriaceae bacterium]
MSTQVAAEPVAAVAVPQWSWASRIAFRFCVVYFGLFCLCTQIITSLLINPQLDFPDPGALPPLRQIVAFAATHIFHLKASSPDFFMDTGSGDRPCDWVLLACVLVFAIAGTMLWSLLDRARPNYIALRRWFWLFFRFALAGQMFAYAFAKIVPLQMPFPALFKLIEPIGDQSPMGVLWNSIGAAPAYEIFAGSAELLGGLLILIPRTRTLGALVCLADMIQVFLLNMTYDVPVKILSFHLILLALVILATDLRRMMQFFLLSQPAEAPAATTLFQTRRANRSAAGVQIVFAFWLLGNNAWGARIGWKTYGGGMPRPALYGVWDVEQQTVDGQVRPPLFTDNDRWRRILFDRHNLVVFERFNDERVLWTGTVDPRAGTIRLSQRGNGPGGASLSYTQPSPDRLTLDGTLSGHRVHLDLALYDRSKFLLVSRGFHWVQESPLNR